MNVKVLLISFVLVSFGGFLLLVGCADQMPTVAELRSAEAEDTPQWMPKKKTRKKGFIRYKAELERSVTDSEARGHTAIRIDAVESRLEYRLRVNMIVDAFVAHIHMRAPGDLDGPPVATLFTKSPEGTDNGLISKGVITAGDLEGPLAGMQIRDLHDAIMAGRTYVNVHTSTHPGGEIRGDIVPQQQRRKKVKKKT